MKVITNILTNAGFIFETDNLSVNAIIEEGNLFIKKQITNKKYSPNKYDFINLSKFIISKFKNDKMELYMFLFFLLGDILNSSKKESITQFSTNYFSPMINIIITILSIIVIGFILPFVKNILKYNSVIYKVLNTYYSKKELTIKNVQKERGVYKYNVFVQFFLMILFLFIINFIVIQYIENRININISMISIAYIFSYYISNYIYLMNDNNIITKKIVNFILLLQEPFVVKSKDEDIEMCIEAFEYFLKEFNEPKS